MLLSFFLRAVYSGSVTHAFPPFHLKLKPTRNRLTSIYHTRTQERTLADIVGDGGGKGGDERGGENASKEGQGQGRGVKKEAREQQRNGGGAAGRGGGGGGEGGPGREWRVVRSEATTVAPPHKGQPRRKVLEVEGKKVRGFSSVLLVPYFSK